MNDVIKVYGITEEYLEVPVDVKLLNLKLN